MEDALQVAFREPMQGDIEQVGWRMRAIDYAECQAMGYTCPWSALAEAVDSSTICWTGTVDEAPHAMFGVVPISAASGLGSPWFLGSDTARKVSRLFLTEAPKYLARIEVIFPRLEGMVSARNHSARRWLVRMGFAVEGCYQEMRGEPMHKFTKGF